MAGESGRILKIIFAGEASGAKKAIGEVDQAAGGLELKLGKAGEMLGKLGAAAGIGAIGHELATFAGEANASIGKLQSQLGLTREEAQQLGTVGQAVFRQGLGASLTDVNAVVADVTRSLGLQGDELAAISADVIRVSDAFSGLGAEPQLITEDLRAMKAAFPGMTEAQSLDLITMGFQNSAGSAGDLQDSLREYPSHFAAIGLSGNDMMTFFSEGMKAGALNTDSLGDAVKEFGIRVQTAGETGQQAIQEMFPPDEAQRLISDFAQGGEAGRQAFVTVFEQLQNTSDEQERYNLAVQLFGSKGEDLVGVMDRMSPSFLATRDASQEVVDKTASLDAQYTGLGHTLETAKRAIETSLLGPLQQIAPVAQPAIDGLSGFGTAAMGLSALGVPVGGMAKKVGGSLLGLAVGPQAPFVLAGIAAVGLGVLIFTHWDEIKAKSEEIWGAVGSFLGSTWDGLKTSGKETWTGIRDDSTRLAGEAKAAVTGAISDAKTTLSTTWTETATLGRNTWTGIKTDTGTLAGEAKVAVTGAISDAKTTLGTTWTDIKTDAVTKWGEIKKTFVDTKDDVKGALLAPFGAARDEIGGIGKAFGNVLIRGWNKDLGAAFDFADYVGKAINGISSALHLGNIIPVPFKRFEIQKFHSGVRNFGGGMAIVGDGGPELLNLPRGTDVLSVDQTRRILAGVDATALGGPVDFAKGLLSGVTSLAGSVADRLSGFLAQGAGQVVEQAFATAGVRLDLSAPFSGVASALLSRIREGAVALIGSLLEELKGMLGGDWVKPLANYVVTQEFGPSSAGLGYSFHSGIDLAAPLGRPIMAAHGGTVSTAAAGGYNSGYGSFVALKHENGFSTLYGHMQTVLAQLGSQVRAGQQIGTVDSTGNSTGHHLHFEVRENGSAVNPRTKVPGLFNGGIVEGSPEGTLIRAGERNRTEAVIPLEEGGGRFSQFVVNETINLDGRMVAQVTFPFIVDWFGRNLRRAQT